MAKTKKKMSEKLGEMVGSRRPIMGALLVLLGAILLISIVFYKPGQDVFFKPYLESFMSSTNSAGANFFGKTGATFCLVSLVSFGAAAFMIPLYILWCGVLCFQRKVSAVSKTELLAIVLGILLFSMLSAIIQAAVSESGAQTSYFPAGYGGKFGTVFFDAVLSTFFDIWGSLILVGVFLLFCLFVVFVETPAEALKEIWKLLRVIPFGLWWLIKTLWKAIIFLPKLWLDILVVRRIRKIESASDKLESAILNAVAADETQDDVPIQSELESQSDDNKFVKETLTGEDDLETQYVDLTNVKVDLSDSENISSRYDDDEEIIEEPVKSSKKSIKSKSAKFEVQEGVMHLEKSSQKLPKKKGDYIFPSTEILNPAPVNANAAKENHEERITQIIKCLAAFNIPAEPRGAIVGPVLTRYEVEPDLSVKVNKIEGLESNIAMALMAEKVRIIAPIPGTRHVGFEVPNKVRQMVSMRDIIESEEFNKSKAELPIAIGKDITGKPVVADFAKMPHALIAGTTGSGKSVCLNSIVVSLLYRMTPDDLRFIMVDPKVIELKIFTKLPHMLVPVVTEVKKVPAALNWLIGEMMRRYKMFEILGVKNIAGFNAKILATKKEKEARLAAAEAAAASEDTVLTMEERNAMAIASEEIDSSDIEIPDKKLPYIVCIIDELADMMQQVGKEVEPAIGRLTQLARAAGIHLLIATQRPSTDVITGVIKSNLPSRLALKVSSQIDSRTILDHKGAESLIGNGDMLFVNGGKDAVRVQGAYLSEDEIEKIVEALSVNGEPEYVQEVQDSIDSGGDESYGDSEYDDPMVSKAIEVIRTSQKASTSLLQRKLGIGYGRAAKIIDILEEDGKIGPATGAQGQREIYL